MKSIYALLNKTKVADFRLKNNDFSKSKEVCHVIHIFFGSPLVKI